MDKVTLLIERDFLAERVKDLEKRLNDAVQYIEESIDLYHIHEDRCRFLRSPTWEDCYCGADAWARCRDKFVKDNKRVDK